MNVKHIITLIAVSVLLTGCLKPLVIKKTDNKFAAKRPLPVQTKRKDNGAIYQQGMRVGLFSDTTAKYIGDVLTINLVEKTNANASSNTTSSKENTVELPGPTLAGKPVTKDGVDILNNSFEGERDFNGEGSSTMNSNFTGKISVTVADVLPNNNLVVRGEKLMMLNQSDEYVRFIGIVRTQDIGQDNTIESTRVANVHMAYGGQGDLASANKLGSLGRFFQSQAWPY